MDSRTEQVTFASIALMDRAQLQRLEDKYVTRTIRCVPDKFIDMCHMHLAFLLDLSGDKLEMLLTTRDEHKKKKSSLVSVSVFKKKEKLQTDLFGAPLTDEGVCLMIPLINFLKLEKNICKEGLFRKPGNKNRMTTLRELLVAHGPAVSIDHEIYSPYDVACVLKEFLRELPEPLLTERHMEAHSQVIALGRHARTPEDIARYTHKKLSALQLLMQLLPSPVQKLTMHLLKLLCRIADCLETKMTPATLGTIFAPIFFIDRNIEASELCRSIFETSPAVSFMIEKADDLFHVPKELIVDLANYWNAHTSACADKSPDSGQIKNSLSGRTLNTSVCYIDRELSRCDDIAGNTQAELANLFAHVQTLPDTPNNIRLKTQILKSTTTPVSSSKKHGQTRSISASIKKRLPSLGRSKKKLLGDISSFSNSATSSKDTKDYGVMSYNCTEKVAVVHCAQIDHKHVQPLRKRLNFYSLLQTMVTPSMSELLESPAQPTGQKYLQRSLKTKCKLQPTFENTDNSADCECSPPKQERKDIASCETVIFTNRRQNSCKELSSKTRLHENYDPSTPVSAPKVKAFIRASSVGSVSRAGLSSRNAFIQSENEITYLPHYAAKSITVPMIPKRDNRQVTVHHRVSKAPWTPVMPRAPLQLVQNNSLETSI